MCVNHENRYYKSKAKPKIFAMMFSLIYIGFSLNMRYELYFNYKRHKKDRNYIIQIYLFKDGFIFITRIVLAFDLMISTADPAIAYLHFHEKNNF